MQQAELRRMHAPGNYSIADLAELFTVSSLPREGLVLRLATATPAQIGRAHKVVTVCQWVAKHNGPALAPTELPQPVFASATVATVWPYLPPSHTPDPAALGAALQDLHAITAPTATRADLPTADPPARSPRPGRHSRRSRTHR